MASNKKTAASMAGIVIRAVIKVLVYFLIAVVFYFSAARAYSFGHKIFLSEAVSAPPGVEQTVVIKGQTSVMETGEMLKLLGLIDDKAVFYIQSKFYDYTVYPGTYQLNSAMTSREILEEISQEPEETPTETTPPAETEPGEETDGQQ